jgi:DNA helicase-2/ATP-dependent DNA helicase PcrA
MTRARETLTLTRAVYRRYYGTERLKASEPSRFLSEIPGELIEPAAGSLAAPGETRRYEPDPEYSYSADEFLRRVRRQAPESTHERAPRRAASSSGTPRAPKGRSADPLVGQRVRHPVFGLGTVIAVDGEDEERKLTVSFPGRATKKFVERYANLSLA